MAITITEGNEATFTPAPEGVHQAVCCDIITAYQVSRKKPDGSAYKRDEITLVFQLNKQNPDNENKRFLVRRVFGMTLNEKSHLRPFLENWRGKKFTKDDFKSPGFDVEKLLGVNCNVQILHNGDWANIAGVMPLNADQPKIEVQNYTRKVADEPQPVASAEAVSQALTNAGVPDDVPF